MLVFPRNVQCTEARTPSLSFHDTVPVDASVLSFTEEEFRPTNGLRSVPFKFDIETKEDKVIDLNRTLLDIKLKVVDANGGNVTGANNADLTLAGNPISTLWKHIEVRLNDKVINVESSRHVAQKGTIEEWLQHTQLDDRSVGLALPDSSNKGGISTANGWRQLDFRDGNLVQFVGQPPVDFLKVNNYLSPRNLLSLTFHPEDHDKIILNADQPGYKIVIASMILHVRHIQVAPSVTSFLPQMGDSNRKEVYYSRFGCIKDYQIPKSTLQWTQHVITGNGTLPKYVLLGLVSNDALGHASTVANGKKTKGPCHFEPFALSHCSLRAGENYYPIKPYTPAADSGDSSTGKVRFLREYYSLFDQLGVVHHFITHEHFANGGAFLLPFNLTSDMRSYWSQDLLAAKHGPLEIELNFHSRLPETITMFLYLVYDQTVSIMGSTGLPVEEQF